MGLAGVFDAGALANVSVFTVVGEGCSRFVETKWSFFSFTSVKLNGFAYFFLQDASEPHVVALASQSSPQSSPGMPQMHPRLLQRSQRELFGFSRWGHIYIYIFMLPKQIYL